MSKKKGIYCSSQRTAVYNVLYVAVLCELQHIPYVVFLKKIRLNTATSKTHENANVFSKPMKIAALHLLQPSCSTHESLLLFLFFFNLLVFFKRRLHDAVHLEPQHIVSYMLRFWTATFNFLLSAANTKIVGQIKAYDGQKTAAKEVFSISVCCLIVWGTPLLKEISVFS